MGRYFSNYRHVLDNMFSNEGFPTDEEMYLFLKEYQLECSKVQGKHYLEQNNSIQQLTREVKVFLLDALTIDFFFCLVLYSLDPKGEKSEYFLVCY